MKNKKNLVTILCAFSSLLGANACDSVNSQKTISFFGSLLDENRIPLRGVSLDLCMRSMGGPAGTLDEDCHSFTADSDVATFGEVPSGSGSSYSGTEFRLAGLLSDGSNLSIVAIKDGVEYPQKLEHGKLGSDVYFDDFDFSPINSAWDATINMAVVLPCSFNLNYLESPYTYYPDEFKCPTHTDRPIELTAAVQTQGSVYSGGSLSFNDTNTFGGGVFSYDSQTGKTTSGFNCGWADAEGGGNSCKAGFKAGSKIEIIALSNSYVQASEFQGWDNCPSVNPQNPRVCSVEVTKGLPRITAKFALSQTVKVSLSKIDAIGGASSTIISDIGGIKCGLDCRTQDIQVLRGTRITLTVIPAPGASVAWWSTDSEHQINTGLCQEADLQCSFTATTHETRVAVGFETR